MACAAHSRADKRGQRFEQRSPRKVSRLMEFCSERDLQNQTGHSVYDWPPQPAIAREIRADRKHVREHQNQGAQKPARSGLRDPHQAHRSALGRRGSDRADATQLDDMRAQKQRAKKKAGDFTERDEEDEEGQESDE